jgi:hypothetical protein
MEVIRYQKSASIHPHVQHDLCSLRCNKWHPLEEFQWLCFRMIHNQRANFPDIWLTMPLAATLVM